MIHGCGSTHDFTKSWRNCTDVTQQLELETFPVINCPTFDPFYLFVALGGSGRCAERSTSSSDMLDSYNTCAHTSPQSKGPPY
eukprot:585159-Amphidinium_carterae.1